MLLLLKLFSILTVIFCLYQDNAAKPSAPSENNATSLNSHTRTRFFKLGDDYVDQVQADGQLQHQRSDYDSMQPSQSGRFQTQLVGKAQDNRFPTALPFPQQDSMALRDKKRRNKLVGSSSGSNTPRTARDAGRSLASENSIHEAQNTGPGLSPLLIEERQQVDAGWPETFNELVNRIWQYPSYSSSGLDPTLHLELPYWPYSLHFQRHFDPPVGKEKVCSKLTPDQALIIRDRISQIRPYSTKVIYEAMRSQRFTVNVALDLLSNEKDLIDSAVDSIFKMDQVASWMSRMTKEQRRIVIERLGEATNQPSDDLREAFLDPEKNIPHTVGWQVLNATSQGEIAQIAAMYDIRVRDVERKENSHIRREKTKTRRPWQKGVGKVQRAAVLQRMMEYSGCSENRCHTLFQRVSINDGFGLIVLKADKNDFVRIMSALKLQPKIGYLLER
jgi:hypothetical protein